MNNNNIIIFIFIIIFVFSVVSCSFNFSNTKIEIEKLSKNEIKNKDLFTYKIKIRANDNLKYFIILPSIKGLNNDSKLIYSFNEKTRYAELDYFYLMPNNIKSKKTVKLL